jgi:hypothetical protein
MNLDNNAFQAHDFSAAEKNAARIGLLINRVAYSYAHVVAFSFPAPPMAAWWESLTARRFAHAVSGSPILPGRRPKLDFSASVSKPNRMDPIMAKIILIASLFLATAAHAAPVAHELVIRLKTPQADIVEIRYQATTRQQCEADKRVDVESVKRSSGYTLISATCERAA